MVVGMGLMMVGLVMVVVYGDLGRGRLVVSVRSVDGYYLFGIIDY